MFTTLGNFSIVYFTLAAVLFILILFEKHFIRLEDKIRAKKASRTNSRKQAAPARKAQETRNVNKCRNAAAVRRIPHNAA